MVSTNSSPGNSSPQKSAAPVLGTFMTAVLAVLALVATAMPEMQVTPKSQVLPASMDYWHPTVLIPRN